MRNPFRRRPPAGSPAARRPLARRAIEDGLVALLIFSPLPAASVNEWSVFIIELAAGLMAAAYILLEPKPRLNEGLAAALKPMKAVAAGFFGFLVFQIIPLPAALVHVLSPGAYGFRKLYAPEFARTRFMSLSVAPGRTLQAGLEILAYFIVGFLLVMTVTRGSQMRKIIHVLIGCGVFQAVYGIYALAAPEPRILFYRKVFSPDSVTGTFVNRSHLSGYLEMIVPLAIGLAIARMNLFSVSVKNLRERFVLMMSQGVAANLLIGASIVVMSLAILLSNSRSGLVVLVFGFFLFTGLAVLAVGRAGYRELWVRNFIRGTVIVILALSLYVGIGSTIQRFAMDDLLHEDRPLYWSNVMGMIRDFPLFGTGLGTFAAAYPAYEKRGGPEMLLTHAHNDYLEYVSELGLVGALLLFGGIFYLAVKAFLAWKERRNPEVKGLALGGIVSLAGMGLHTVTDFNLHIPANMLLFTVVLSLTLVASYHRKA
ncbi:MAG: O-antigen ligase family protein [Acidobacteriota bacterium]